MYDGSKKWVVLGGSLLALALLFWISCRQHDTWVIPRIEGVVLNSDGDRVPISKSDIIVSNDMVGEVHLAVDLQGGFVIREAKVLTRANFPGDRCFWTLVRIHPEDFHPCEAEVGICTGELDGSSPPSTRLVEFRLEDESSSLKSTASVSWVSTRMGVRKSD